jgi:hypothetical protein
LLLMVLFRCGLGGDSVNFQNFPNAGIHNRSGDGSGTTVPGHDAHQGPDSILLTDQRARTSTHWSKKMKPPAGIGEPEPEGAEPCGIVGLPTRFRIGQTLSHPPVKQTSASGPFCH